MSKISIVLPVYNGGQIVSKSIESVLCQTFSNWELIIVNDCSTDNTLDVIERYKKIDPRIFVISNLTNQKLPHSLNIGFEKATGDYFTWTSDDNQFLPNALEIMSAYLDNHTDVDFVYADYNIVDMNGKILSTERKPEPDIIKYGSMIGACFLYRQTLAKIVGPYNPDMFLAEDYDFFIRCYKYGTMHHLPEILYSYGKNEKSLTATRLKDIRHQTYVVMKTHFEFLYSKCKTKKEQNIFLFTMIDLLDDENKKNNEAQYLFSVNKWFSLSYRKRQLKNFIKHLIGLQLYVR